MSVKRRDNKNRILQDGEYQDPSGRYRYVYYENGKQKCIYSWKLDKRDILPAGKRACLSLRERKAQLQHCRELGVAYQGGNVTVLELVQRHVKQKWNCVRHSTRAGYQTVLNLLEKDPFGRKRIDRVRISDAKLWFVGLQTQGKGYSSIHSIRGVLRPAFQMAVDDDLLAKNPFDFPLSSVVINDSVTREALTPEQEREFLEFVKGDAHFSRYYDGICILFKTGLRISEFCGLTKKDIDLKKRRIRVDHQLQRTSKMEYLIIPTKTNAGTRVLPMTQEVYDCFCRILQNRPVPRREPMIGGHTGFLYLDGNGRPMVSLHWEKYFQRILEKYDRTHTVRLPRITPHVCRHTYCSNMVRANVNIKTVQYLMGHSEIGVTMDTYTHVTYDDARKELERLELLSGRDDGEAKQA